MGVSILAAIDFSQAAPFVVKAAAQLARAFNRPLYLLHVASPDPDFVGYEAGPESVRSQVATRFSAQHRQLQSMADALKKEGLQAEPLLVQGPTTEKILKEAAQLEADWIVVGSHGHSALYHAVMGSVTEGILRKASCAVVVIPRI